MIAPEGFGALPIFGQQRGYDKLRREVLRPVRVCLSGVLARPCVSAASRKKLTSSLLGGSIIGLISGYCLTPPNSRE